MKQSITLNESGGDAPHSGRAMEPLLVQPGRPDHAGPDPHPGRPADAVRALGLQLRPAGIHGPERLDEPGLRQPVALGAAVPRRRRRAGTWRRKISVYTPPDPDIRASFVDFLRRVADDPQIQPAVLAWLNPPPAPPGGISQAGAAARPGRAGLRAQLALPGEPSARQAGGGPVPEIARQLAARRARNAT